jgi:RNA methyltransferase, TrmH family
MILSSLQNPSIKRILSLQKRREREALGITPVEGCDEVALAIDSGVRPISLYICPSMFSGVACATVVRAAREDGAEVMEVSERVFTRIAYREHPDGVLALLPMPAKKLSDVTLGPVPLVLVAEAIEKPGNLGAMVRTADAANLDAVIAAGARTDWGNPNVVRASKATVFTVQVCIAESAEVIQFVHERRMRIVAASPDASLVYTEADLRGSLAIAVGSERHGLDPCWIQEADVAVKIPMEGRVNSLNVATAAALLIYGARRQRS